MIGNDCLRHCAENTKSGRRRWSVSNVCLTQGIWKGQHYAMYLLTLAVTIFFLSWAVVIVSRSAFLPPGLHTPVRSPHPATTVSNLHLTPPSSYDSHGPGSQHRVKLLGNRAPARLCSRSSHYSSPRSLLTFLEVSFLWLMLLFFSEMVSPTILPFCNITYSSKLNSNITP